MTHLKCDRCGNEAEVSGETSPIESIPCTARVIGGGMCGGRYRQLTNTELQSKLFYQEIRRVSSETAELANRLHRLSLDPFFGTYSRSPEYLEVAARVTAMAANSIASWRVL